MSRRMYYDLEELQLYKKKKCNIHFVKSLNVKDPGEPIKLHTLEGDVTIPAGEEYYIMMGTFDDIYPIGREQFESKYQPTDEKNIDCVKATAQKNNIPLDKIEGCCLEKDSYVYAKKVTEDFTVYSKYFNYELKGSAGDYYAVSFEDVENVYIIRGDIMDITYEKAENTK